MMRPPGQICFDGIRVNYAKWQATFKMQSKYEGIQNKEASTSMSHERPNVALD